VRTVAFRVSPNALQRRPRCLNRTGWNKLGSQRTCNDSGSVELERHKRQQSESENMSKTIFVELGAMWQSITCWFRTSLNSYSQIWAFKATAYLGPSHAGALRPALVHQRCRRLIKTPRRQTVILAQACLGVFSAVQRALKRAKLNSLTRTTAQYVARRA
jgi:hypothetical protein